MHAVEVCVGSIVHLISIFERQLLFSFAAFGAGTIVTAAQVGTLGPIPAATQFVLTGGTRTHGGLSSTRSCTAHTHFMWVLLVCG